jgi:prophage regulatory protein
VPLGGNSSSNLDDSLEYIMKKDESRVIHSNEPAELRFIRLKEVLAICGKSRSSVYEAIKKGEFPSPVKLRGRSSAWIKSEVLQWAEACVRASRTPARASLSSRVR